jgi:hypothetical protein
MNFMTSVFPRTHSARSFVILLIRLQLKLSSPVREMLSLVMKGKNAVIANKSKLKKNKIK